MTQPTGGYVPPHGEEPQSTPEVARNEAFDVARTAAQSGGQVGDTAGEQAKRVAAETARQARDLMQEGRDQLVDQAREGQRKAASSMHTLADQLRDMSQKADGEGLAPEMVRQASDRTRSVAAWLDEREPGALLDEVRRFARRKPGMFLAGAAVAGVLIGRLTRGAVAAARDDSSPGERREPVARSMPTPPPVTTPDPYAEPALGAVPGQPVAGPGYATPPPPPPVTQPGAPTAAPGRRPGPVTR
ncbi:MAG: hypothetical protein GEV28_16390 [Actinophytocola sp.]|uniref:hypothetical protein n=1 Tax=Actinophytocola sp. TaxID=1872138 RepID=UPI0013297D82|nr:hypothetical protein [Actinophytocola sp.]MPZ81878.1 hypothetical protein [Actinophytocola sp.]